jgi:hypothetical protein
MERLRTLLLARSHVVVLDPDRVASAATRPLRDSDVDRLEGELAQLGFVMSLDLAMALRRLPGQALEETRAWLRDSLGSAPPQAGSYLQRILPWLAARADQPCPWCARITLVGALDPCGHLVCRECWSGGSFAGCPICHRRVAPGEPFVEPPESGGHGGRLVLLHLGIDLAAGARARLERLLARGTALAASERDDVETIVDTIGPRVVDWLPARIPERATMAVVLARLMQIAPEPSALARGAAVHLAKATCVLRVAAVLLGGNPELAQPMRLRSTRRALRRAVLEALDRLPAAEVAEEVARHRTLWKRIGEQLHPGELATELPNAARAFALARSRGPIARWAAPVELAVRRRDAAAALPALADRPEALLRRCDQLLRIATPDARPAIEDAIARALPHASPAHLLVLASHLARRGAAWPRRVFLRGDLLRAWTVADVRPALHADAIVGAIRGELLARAERRRNFPRAMLDRALVDALLWSRGSERALPAGVLALTGCSALELFDERWRHVATIADPRELRDDLAFHVLVVARGREVRVGELRFELHGRAALDVPLAIDLSTRRVRSLDLRIADTAALVRAGGYRAALAHAARDVADWSLARPTPWDLACIHAAARANVIYVRERDHSFTIYRRRDREPPRARLDRLLTGTADSFRLAAVPVADAPTWFALVTGDVTLPAGSAGFTLDGLTPAGATPLSARDLIAELQ